MTKVTIKVTAFIEKTGLYIFLKQIPFNFTTIFNCYYMSPIVVDIDFSNASVHALEYAISIANKMDSDIILLRVEKVANQEDPDENIHEERHDSRQLLLEMISHYQPLLKKGLKMDFKLRRGKVHIEVENLARSVGASFIVTCSRGAGGFEEYLNGGSNLRIMTHPGCPLITVHHAYSIKKTIDTILVPIDTSGETIQKLPAIAKFAKLFNAEVHVVATHYSHLASLQRVTEKNVEKAMNYLLTQKIKIVQDKIISNDITRAVIAYAQKINADLIGIMSEEETPANMLLGPHAQQLVNQSPVPVLSIHPGEMESI